MIDALSVPPAALVLLVGLVALFAPRTVGYAAAVVALAGVAGWTRLVPDGSGLTVDFLGFTLVLVAVDEVSRLVGLVLAGFGVAAVGYAAVLEVDRAHLAVALAYVAASLWAVFAGDWLTLVVGWELMAVASTALLWLAGGDAVRAGFRYALVHAVGGVLLLVGVALEAAAVGPGPTALHHDGTGITPGLAALAVGAGIAVNAAAIGVHVWLPRAYAAPHVATSVILSAYTTKVAVYAAYRAFPEGNLVLAYLGGAMAIYGAAFALAQKDMRALLSYHIQAQVGYMLAGIGIGSALGVAGGFAHLTNNVLYKGLLFMVAGILVVRTGHERLDGFGALRASAPVVALAFVVAAASIGGVPGTNGFVSKGMVLDAAMDADAPLLRALLFVGTVGTVLSFCKFGYYAFLDGPETSIPDASRGHAVVTLAIAGACLTLGLAYGLLFSQLPATDAWTTDPYSSRHLLEKGLLVATGVVAFRLAKPLFARLEGGIDVDRVRDPLVFYGTRVLVSGLESGSSALDAQVARLGWGVVDAVQEPAPRIRGALPPAWRDRYDRRRASTPGETGLRVGIGTSLLVAVGVTGFALGVAFLL